MPLRALFDSYLLVAMLTPCCPADGLNALTGII
mgnify:CR=1 FL=1